MTAAHMFELKNNKASSHPANCQRKGYSQRLASFVELAALSLSLSCPFICEILKKASLRRVMAQDPSPIGFAVAFLPGLPA